MFVNVKASDLKFKYPRNIKQREEPKFCGIPDPAPFDRNDLYEILPVMGAVMGELETVDGNMLHALEDLLNEMPRFIVSREDVFSYLTGCGRELMSGQGR